MAQVKRKTLQVGDEGFERYIDELVEECARFIQLVAQLRQLPEGESPERDKLETEFFRSLAHLKEHSASLSERVDQLIELSDESCESRVYSSLIISNTFTSSERASSWVWPQAWHPRIAGT